MGKPRKAWRDHLAANEDALRRVAHTLGISVWLESGNNLGERLNHRFARVGMKLVSSAKAGFFYDDVIAKLHAQGHSIFDRHPFKDMCANENLLDDGVARPVTVGVRSFMHAFGNLEARCDQALNSSTFEGRYIRDLGGVRPSSRILAPRQRRPTPISALSSTLRPALRINGLTSLLAPWQARVADLP